ncbi:kinase-like domain-containing protein [Scenedesmus sp. NREL 46B-D3]|nr:kinase-like domain-containing protein [Scenedesmus sp. NREL 46B-D3]
MLQQKYKFIKHLGGGAFGAVVQAEDVQTGEVVAVKKLQRLHYSPYFLSEILNHRQLCHPHVVKFHEVFPTNNHLNIVMEYANGGSLFDYVKQHRRLPEKDARWFFQQMMIAVDYCHKKGVTNRDIKLENILLHHMQGRALSIVKLCDWGYSKLAEAGPRTAVGTVAYMAPEVLQNCLHSAEQLYDGFAADLWSCGVVLYTMLLGRRPFADERGANKQLLEQMASQAYELPNTLSRDCQALLRRLLHPDPAQRIKMDGVLRDPWFLTGGGPLDLGLAGHIQTLGVLGTQTVCCE